MRLKYEHALGLVTRSFQEMELYFALLAWGLMGKDQRIGQAITAQMSFSKLLILVSTVYKTKTKDRELLKELKYIIRQASDAEQKRNRIIHSAYLQTSSDPNARSIRYKITTKLEKGLVIHWEDTDFEDIMDIAVEIQQTTALLGKFISESRIKLKLDFSEFSFSKSDSEDDIPF